MPAISPEACTAEFTAALVSRKIEHALALLTEDVVFFYSNGSTIVGKSAFANRMTASWKILGDYVYSHAGELWVAQSLSVASVIYSFSWSGKASGQAVSGSGRASRILRNDGLGWCIAHEHLSAGEWQPLT